MRYIELQGSPLEIGRQHGEAFAEDIRKYYEFYCVRTGKTPGRLRPSIRDYVERRLPEAAEEIDGIARGAGMKYEEILAYNHFNVVSGCTPMFFRNTEIGPLLGQNLDCEPEERQATVIRNVRPDKGNATLSASFIGTVWLGNWINEHGLCRCAVSAHHKGYLTENGTSFGITEMQAARCAATPLEAYEILNSHRHIGKVGVVMLADAEGRAIRLEGNGEELFPEEITDDFAFTTGLYTSGKVEARDEPDYMRPKYARAETVEGLYGEGKIEFSLDGMKRLMSHHAPDPGSVCRHNREQGSCTQSSRILAPRERKMYITDGPPCCSEYEEYELRKK